MDVFRTPEDRFRSLPDFPFEPHYTEVDGLRMHYVDEGNPDAPVVLLLHGEPTWSFLYRRMIPTLVTAGLRAIAPDLIGFGRSDKPVAREAHSYNGHVRWMAMAIENLALKEITLFCQDWGSLIGLRVAAENSDRFARIVLSNGALPIGSRKVPLVLQLWRTYARFTPSFPTGRIVSFGTRRGLSPAERAAYDAPFPDNRFKQGPRALPQIIPLHEDAPAIPENRRAWEVFKKWEKPFLTAFSDGDPITRPFASVFREKIPGCMGLEHPTIRGAGHFLQEDKGPELAMVVTEFIQST